MIQLLGHDVGAVLFDKDGTLLDFHGTWDRAIGATLRNLAPDDDSLQGAAIAVGYDLATEQVRSDSPIIAESNETIVSLLDPWLDTSRFEELLLGFGIASAAPAPGAAGVVTALAERDVPLAIVTNDAAAVARAQLDRLGLAGFAAIVGYDSGYGAKPDPGPVLGAVELLGVTADRAMMVGDSIHDVEAARRAEVRAVYIGSDASVAAVATETIASLAELMA